MKFPKKAIKAALKLCMLVIYFIWVTLKNVSLKRFAKLSWSSPALSPSSNTLDSTRQFLIETLRPEVSQKSTSGKMAPLCSARRLSFLVLWSFLNIVLVLAWDGAEQFIYDRMFMIGCRSVWHIQEVSYQWIHPVVLEDADRPIQYSFSGCLCSMCARC